MAPSEDLAIVPLAGADAEACLALSDAAAIQRHFNNWNIIKNLASVVPWPYPDDGAETFIKQQLRRIAAGTEIYQWAIAHNIWLQLYRL